MATRVPALIQLSDPRVAAQLAGRKIHAGTRHYAVLPLSLAVKPLKCAEGARHDLLPCPDCQNISKYGEICEFLLRFREDRRLRLTYKALECLLQIKTEGTDPVLFDSSRAVENCHWWFKCQGKCQPCYIVMRITVNSVCHA